jgi:hypothetical protein
MTEAEEEEMARVRSERNSDNRRRNAFYGGNQESEKKKIGLDPKETIAEPGHSNSGIATKNIIRCTLGVRPHFHYTFRLSYRRISDMSAWFHRSKTIN